MKQRKIMVVFGTRPEAIKMAPVIQALENNKEKYETKIVVTAQHREMLDQVLEVFDIQPDYDLDVMKENQSLSDITASVLKGLEEIYKLEKPDMVLVHGDTTTSLTAALAAFYQHIAIGHVEAGLRTGDKYFPFPEEANRQLIDNLADLYFVPTKEAKDNLIKENKSHDRIVITGNTVIDAVKYTSKLDIKDKVLQLMKNNHRWILLTMHRRENRGAPMENVFQAVKKIVEENEDVSVLLPVHLSPIIQEHVREALANHNRVHLVPPLDVSIFHKVIAHSYLILTDSGGLQEEAPSLDVPVLVLRNKTERPEGVKAGTLKVIGTEKDTVYKEVDLILKNAECYDKMAKAQNPYGDGKASEKIISAIEKYFYEEK